MLRRTFDVAARVSPQFRRFMMKSWHETVVVPERERDITFMNYGYSGVDNSRSEISMNDGEQANRYCIQLYHHVAAAIDLSGKDVVEVGSGRGGGASYIARYLRPRSMKGVDFSRNAIEFCRQHYTVDGLSFLQGDAENLPLADNRVDAIINLESSHCYGSMTKFLSEVYRVLRPDGHFLFSDHRDRDKLDLLREQLKDSGLRLVKETDITRNVVAALDLDNDRKQRMIAKKCPRVLRREAEEFAPSKSSRAYGKFKARYTRYPTFVLSTSPPPPT